MINIDLLNEQNHKIAELAKILSSLLSNREICDTGVANDLFFNYIGKVTEHLNLEETDLYKLMLLHDDNTIRNTANRFLSGSGEIKRVFKQYQRRWCRHKKLYIKNHDKFMKDSDDMFEMIFNRIVDESEHLYPVARKILIEQEKMAA